MSKTPRRSATPSDSVSAAGGRKRWSAWLGRIGLLVASLGLASLLAEGAVRWLDLPFFADPTEVFDPDLGWTGRPGLVAYRQTSEQQRLVRYGFNRLGFRDREPAAAEVFLGPDPERRLRRLVVLGDSFTQSAQVEMEDTFWFQLGERLNAHGRDYWQVRILGHGDYGTLQQALAFERHGMEPAPNLVILQFFALNDIANNSLAAANIASSNDAFRPYLDPRTDFRTITYVAPWTAQLRRLSAAGRQATLLAQHWFGPWGGEQITTYAQRIANSEAICQSLGLPHDMQHLPILLNGYAPEADQLAMIAQGWKATDAAVERIAANTARVGASLLAIDMPHPSLMRRGVSRYRARLDYSIDPHYPGRRLARVLGDRGTVVDLYEPFEAAPTRALPFIDGHLDLEAHRLVAEVLEAAVIELFAEDFTATDPESASVTP